MPGHTDMSMHVRNPFVHIVLWSDFHEGVSLDHPLTSLRLSTEGL